MSYGSHQTKYEMGRLLGRGHFAQVFLAINIQTKETVAIKVIDKTNLVDSADVNAEIEILRHIGEHTHVVTLLDVFEDVNNFYIVCEYCAGGDLFASIVSHGLYTQTRAFTVLRQLALALQHIHRKNITHRDLKPENILLLSTAEDSVIKIADFGLSKILNSTGDVMHTICGTWAYAAPEVITHQPYTDLVDNWTLGVLFFILFSGYHPFDMYGDLPDPVLLQRIRLGQYSFDDPSWDNIDSEIKFLIDQLLQVDPQKRMSIANFLSHRFISGATKDNVEISQHVVKRLTVFTASRRTLTSVVSAKLAIHKWIKFTKRSISNTVASVDTASPLVFSASSTSALSTSITASTTAPLLKPSEAVISSLQFHRALSLKHPALCGGQHDSGDQLTAATFAGSLQVSWDGTIWDMQGRNFLVANSLLFTFWETFTVFIHWQVINENEEEYEKAGSSDIRSEFATTSSTVDTAWATAHTPVIDSMNNEVQSRSTAVASGGTVSGFTSSNSARRSTLMIPRRAPTDTQTPALRIKRTKTLDFSGPGGLSIERRLLQSMTAQHRESLLRRTSAQENPVLRFHEMVGESFNVASTDAKFSTSVTRFEDRCTHLNDPVLDDIMPATTGSEQIASTSAGSALSLTLFPKAGSSGQENMLDPRLPNMICDTGLR